MEYDISDIPAPSTTSRYTQEQKEKAITIRPSAPAAIGPEGISINDVPKPTPPAPSKETSISDKLHDAENFANTAIARGMANAMGLPHVLGEALQGTGDKIAPPAPAGVIPLPGKMREAVGDLLREHWPSAEDVYKRIMQGVDIGPVANKDTAPGIHIHPTERKPQGPVEEMIASGLENVGPSVATGGGVAIPMAAGVLGKFAEHIFPNHPGLANFITQALSAAGISGAAKLADKGANAIGATVGRITEAGKERTAVEALTKAAGQTPEEFAANIAARNKEIVPGSKPTTADVLDNRGLRREETRLSEDTTQDILHPAREAQHAARVRAIEEQTPNVGGEDTVQAHLKNRADEFERQAAEILERHAKAAGDKVKALGEGTSPEEAGRVIREAYDAGLKEAKANTKTKFEAVDPNGSIALDVRPVKKEAASIEKEFFGEGSIKPSAQWKETKELLDSPKTHLSYRTLQNIRSTASKMAKDNAGSQEGAAWARLKSSIDNRIEESAAAYKEQLDTHNAALKRPREELTPKQRLDKGVAGNFTPEQAGRYEQARAARIEQGERYQKGPSGRIGARTKEGEYKIPDERVAAQYLNPGRSKVADAQQYLKTFGKNEKTAQALQEAAIHDIQKTALKDDGTIDAKKLANWMKQRNNLEHFDDVPGFKDFRTKLQDAQTAQQAVEEVAKRIDLRRKRIDESVVSKFLSKDSNKAVDRVLGSDNSIKEMSELVSLVKKDPSGRALEGLRQAVFDRAKVALESKDFGKWLRDNERKISPAFEPEHLQMLKNIAADIERSTAKGTPVTPKGGVFTLGKALSGFIKEGTANWLAMHGHPFAAVASNFSPMLRASHADIERMFARALVDPEYARTLTLKVTKANAPGIARRWVKQLAQLRRNTIRQAGIAAVEASAPKSGE